MPQYLFRSRLDTEIVGHPGQPPRSTSQDAPFVAACPAADATSTVIVGHPRLYSPRLTHNNANGLYE